MLDKYEVVSQELLLPSLDALAEELADLVAESDTARRCLSAVTTGLFEHPDGRSEGLHDIRIAPAQLALLAHLSKQCCARVSIDIGFGMGSSAAMILAARRSVGEIFDHRAFDPWGLPDGRGRLVQEYLDQTFPDQFLRLWKRSEVGMPALFDQMGYGAVGLVFIDGSHTFEQVMVDFVMSDLVCGVGAYIVFDDALFPAIEAVVDYIRTNRPDYAVSHLPVVNTSVVRKISDKRPEWDAFRPFPVPERQGWTSARPDWVGDLPPPRRVKA